MGRIGGGELLLILLIALLVFGPSKLADMGKGLGEGLKNFKKGLNHDDEGRPPAPPNAPPVPPTQSAAQPPSPGTPAAGANGGNVPPAAG